MTFLLKDLKYSEIYTKIKQRLFENRQKKIMNFKYETPKIERILMFDKIFLEIKWINDDGKVEQCWKL